MKKGLIMIPYAYLDDYNTGANLRKSKAFGIYMKNCCVAAVSARHNSGDNSDVAIISNIDFPPQYRNILDRSGVKFIKFPFDEFCFDKQYKWSLAFYKLCALSKAVKHLHYDYYSYLDSDVYVQGSFDNIWRECDYNIQMYDINEGLNSADYCRVLNEFMAFDTDIKGGITHFGGEFYAANASHSRLFVAECDKVYQQMIERNFATSQGDEFITSIAAYRLKNMVKNSAPYVCRYWTGTYRLISTNYRVAPVTVLHCPAEKKYGIITLFNRYIRRGKTPSHRVVHRLLHLHYPSLLTIAKIIVKKILNRPL
ncbi:MAG: hypothetical protein IKD24_09135 [Alistipes sp.]|nr:hypothetical protein [Alistipes sp.]